MQNKLNHETIAAALNEMMKAGKVSEWRLSTHSSKQTEVYFVRDAREALRTVDCDSFSVEVLKNHPNGRQGYAQLRLAPSHSAWRDDVWRLAEIADTIQNEPYCFPGASSNATPLNLCYDKAISENVEGVIAKMSRDWTAFCKGLKRPECGGHFELFLTETTSLIETSSGLRVQVPRTHFFLEGTLTDDKAERYFQKTGSHLSGFDLEPYLAQLYREFVLSREAMTAPLGEYALLLGESFVADIFSCVAERLNGPNVYQSISNAKLGDVIGARDLNVTANPLVESVTEDIDDECEAVRGFELVKNGVVSGIAANNKYAALMKTQKTGGISSLSVAPGSEGYTELTQGRVIEVVQFSSFHPDSISMQFAGEIRLGYLHENGKKVPIRGGSVTGNILEVLPQARLSREMHRESVSKNGPIERYGYLGPCYLRFEKVSYSG